VKYTAAARAARRSFDFICCFALPGSPFFGMSVRIIAPLMPGNAAGLQTPSPSGQSGTQRLGGEFDGKRIGARVQVVLAGLIDDADVLPIVAAARREHAVNLEYLQRRCIAVVAET
jgi:hypothetical protein